MQIERGRRNEPADLRQRHRLPGDVEIERPGRRRARRVSVPSTVSADSPVRAATDWKRQPVGTLTIRPASDREIQVRLPGPKRQATDVDAQFARAARDPALEGHALHPPRNGCVCGRPSLAP